MAVVDASSGGSPLNSTPDISIKYTLPRYYIPASLKTTCYLFIFSETSFETAKETVDSLIESKKTIKSVRIYTETGVEHDIISEIQTYLQKRIDLNIDDIDVFKNLELLQVIGMMTYFQRDSAYREALQN